MSRPSLYLALITQMNRKPLSYILSNAMFKISASDKLEYPIATPRVGLAVESCHGGSQVMTSNKRPSEFFFCAIESFSIALFLTSVQKGMHQNY